MSIRYSTIVNKEIRKSKYIKQLKKIMHKRKLSKKASIDNLIKPNPKYETPIKIEIDKLLKLDLNKTPYSKVFDKVKVLFQSSWVRTIARHKFTTVYRGRRCNDNKPFVKVSDIWNPKWFSGRYNRFNSPNKNMFYGTLGIDQNYCDKAIRTIIREIGLDSLKYVTAIRFNLRKEYRLVDVIPLGFHPDFIKEIASDELISQYEEILNETQKFVSKINSERKKRITKSDFNRVNELLCKLVTKQIPLDKNFEYKITAAIGEILLDKNNFGGVEKPIGFYYPSVKWCYGTANFACMSEKFNKFYEPTQAFFGMVKMIGEDEHFILQKESSKIENGIILW